ncbi:unnamed protein product, partial [Heterotrigona itama]
MNSRLIKNLEILELQMAVSTRLDQSTFSTQIDFSSSCKNFIFQQREGRPEISGHISQNEIAWFRALIARDGLNTSSRETELDIITSNNPQDLRQTLRNKTHRREP